MQESYIYNPGVDKNSFVNEFYTLMGMEDFIDKNNNPRLNEPDNENVFAKKTVRSDGSVRYSARLSKEGKMLNPVSIYGQEINSNFLDRVCRSSGKFKDLNYKAFDMYINFLKTKNAAWLHNAEREAE